MSNKIKILFIKDPKDLRFIEGTFVNLDREQAYQFIDEGLALQYDPVTHDKWNPLLPEDLPSRDLLFKNDIYTKQDLESHIEDVDEIDNIGLKTKAKYIEFLEGNSGGDQEDG